MVQAPGFIWKPTGTAIFDNVKPFLIRPSGMSFQSKSLLIQKDLEWLSKQVHKWFEVKWSETCISHRRCIDNSTLCWYYRTVWLFQPVGGLFSAYILSLSCSSFIVLFSFLLIILLIRIVIRNCGHEKSARLAIFWLRADALYNVHIKFFCKRKTNVMSVTAPVISFTFVYDNNISL